MKSHKQHISLQKIIDEYNSDIFIDDDKMFQIKEIIESLDDLDKALLIMYAEKGSMAKTGKIFNVSAATIHSNIKRIRKIISDNLNK